MGTLPGLCPGTWQTITKSPVGSKGQKGLLLGLLPLFSGTISQSLVTKQESPAQASHPQGGSGWQQFQAAPASQCPVLGAASPSPWHQLDWALQAPSLYNSSLLLWITFFSKAIAQQREAVQDSKPWNILLIKE